MATKGKGRRPEDIPTARLHPVGSAPEYRSSHDCSAVPRGVSIRQIPPVGWQIVLPGSRGPDGIAGPIRWCPFCGSELEAAR